MPGSKIATAFTVGAVALGLRLLHVYLLHDLELFFGLFLDSEFYARQAALIRAGHGVGDHPYLLSPLYPYLLALFTDASGQLQAVAVQAVQAGFGAATAVLTALIGRRVGGPAVGWIAGLAAAVYGPFVHLDAQILVVCLQTFFVTLGLWLMLGARRAWPGWLSAGLCFGVSAALRPTGLVLILAIAAVLLAGKRWRPAGALVLGAALLVTPFAVRNRVEGGEWVLLSANGGVNFWIGNHEGASGLYEPPPGTDRVNDPLSKVPAEAAVGRHLSYRESSRWWLQRALADTLRNPGGWLVLVVHKLLYFVHPQEVAQLGSSYHWYRQHLWPLRFPLDARWIFLLALLLPWVRGSLPERRLGWVSYLVGVYAATIVLFFITARYRAPILPGAMVLAASAAVGLWHHLRASRATWRAAARWAPLAALVVLAAGSHWLYLSREAPFHVSDSSGEEERHQGMALAEAGRHAEAVAAYRRSLAIAENHHTRTNLANALYSAGRIDEAIAEYRALLDRYPDLPLAWYNFGYVLDSQRRYQEAGEAYVQAIRYAPRLPEAYYRLGVLYLRLRRPEPAQRALEQSLALAPPNAGWRERAEGYLLRLRQQQPP